MWGSVRVCVGVVCVVCVFVVVSASCASSAKATAQRRLCGGFNVAIAVSLSVSLSVAIEMFVLLFTGGIAVIVLVTEEEAAVGPATSLGTTITPGAAVMAGALMVVESFVAGTESACSAFHVCSFR